MISLYLRIAVKNILKSPLFTMVNIVGISLAMVCVFLLSLWLRDEMRFDKHLPYKDRLYRLTIEVNDPSQNLHSHFARTYQQWPAHLKDHFPEVEEVTRLSRIYDMVVKDGEKQFTGRFHQADSSFIRIFGLKLISGDPATALVQPHSVIITKSFAQKYFPATDLLGHVIQVYCRNCPEKTEFRITGVMEDLPRTSHFSLDMLASFPNPEEIPDWAYYYILLKDGVQPDSLERKLPGFIKETEGEVEAKVSTPHLQKVTDIHLYSDKDRELGENGNIRIVKVFVGITIFILFIALINFLNLRLAALLASRKNFLAMKTFGAGQGNLYLQTLVELSLIIFIALLIAWIVLILSIGTFNEFSRKEILLLHEGNGIFLFFLTVALSAISLLTGMQPAAAFFSGRRQSAFFSIRAQEGEIAFFRKGGRPSFARVLIVLQFAASVMLIAGAITMRDQAKLLLNNRLGKDNERIICLNNLPVQVVDHYREFKRDLLSSPIIKDVTATMEDPGDEALDKMSFQTTGISEEAGKKMIYVYPTDDNTLSFYHIPIVAGENFPEYNGNDSLPENYILNESAVRMLGLTPEEAIGKPFKLVPGWDGGTIFHEGKIIGVAKDFYTGSLRFPLMPMCYFQKKFWLYSCQIKIEPSQVTRALEQISVSWNKAYPEFPMNYSFIEDLYNRIYAQEIRQERLLMLFSVLAIFISCLGIWSVSSLLTRQRTKEIGIRKVNGATSLDIIFRLNREFLVLNLVSIVLAIPVSWYLLNHWLQNYSNKVHLGIGIFVLAGILPVLTTIITVSLQSWKSAARNPIMSLRYE